MMNMSYDFTSQVDRKNEASYKWMQMYGWNENVDEDVVPLSVADMEFYAAPEILEGIKEYLIPTRVLGYTGQSKGYLDAVVDWQKRRHDWDIQPEWIVSTPGVVAAIHTAVRTFTNEGDGVIIFKPVYYPFSMVIADNHRTEVNVPLLEKDGYYTIDFEKFEEEAAKAENKVLIFCSPHNPVGRVWTKEELTKLAEICVRHQLYVISDEIWYDFVMPGYTHTVFATVNEALNERLIVCTAASKTFNLAGMTTSNIIVPNEETRALFKEGVSKGRFELLNMIGYRATEVAYTRAEKWFDELLSIIHTNQQMVHQFFKNRYPKIKAPLIEGTYLQWLDCKEVGMSDEELEAFLHEKAQFFTDEGYIFGVEGSGFERINLAVPTHILERLLNRLVSELEKAGY